MSVDVAAVTGDGGHAGYSLYLRDAVHDAPDLMAWDPKLRVAPAGDDFKVAYERLSDHDRMELRDSSGALLFASLREGRLNGRDIQDAAFTVELHSQLEVKVGDLSYLQQFDSARVSAKGNLVPLSRGAPCAVARSRPPWAEPGPGIGAVPPGCPYTDGQLAKPAVDPDDPDACFWLPDGKLLSSTYVYSGKTVPCQDEISVVTVDLGAPKPVGEISPACGDRCKLTGSVDGAQWFPLTGIDRHAGRTTRYVSVTGHKLGGLAEISVWPPTPVASSPIPAPAQPRRDGDARPLPLVFLALGTWLVAAGVLFRAAHQRGPEFRATKVR